MLYSAIYSAALINTVLYRAFIVLHEYRAYNLCMFTLCYCIIMYVHACTLLYTGMQYINLYLCCIVFQTSVGSLLTVV